jgi:hypothetical protein
LVQRFHRRRFKCDFLSKYGSKIIRWIKNRVVIYL